jgi:hypothetical protein
MAGPYLPLPYAWYGVVGDVEGVQGRQTGQACYFLPVPKRVVFQAEDLAGEGACRQGGRRFSVAMLWEVVSKVEIEAGNALGKCWPTLSKTAQTAVQLLPLVRI